MVLDFPGVPSIFKQSPEDWENLHYEGEKEIPAPPPGGSGSPATSGAKSPGTMATVGTLDVQWANPDNAKLSNNTYTTASTGGLPFQTMDYLTATNFSFAIPTGATITGVELQVERKADFNDEVKDFEVKLVVGGSKVGTSQSTQQWVTTERIDTIGGSSNLWGTTLTPAQVNGATFGVAIRPEVYSGGGGNVQSVDHIQLNIHYTT